MAQNPKFLAEATAQGCVILGPGQTAHYRTYLLPCGHEQQVSLKAMRQPAFRCRTCMGAKHTEEAAAQGCTILGPGRNAEHRNYRLPCGHVQQVALKAMRQSTFRCRTCMGVKHTEEAAAQGCTILGPGRDHEYRNYRLPCGHEQEVGIGAMARGQFCCRTCLEMKRAEEAAAQGCVILGPGRNYNYRNYRLSCGHVQEVGIGSMARSSFRCSTCEDTYVTQPSNVYLLRICNGEDQWLKLGYAKHVGTRTTQYGLPEGATVEMLTAVCFPTGAEAHEFEAALHDIHRASRLSPRYAKKLGMNKQGQTECYPIEIENSLLSDLVS